LRKQAPVDKNELSLEEVEKPLPKDNQLLIKIKSCAICRTDIHIIEGDMPPLKLPLIPGHQIVGVIEEVGDKVSNSKIGDYVGVPWLYRSCGVCRFCKKNLENLCDNALFTGYSVDGGYAEYMLGIDDFALPLPRDVDDTKLAPFLCGGAIGFRALKLTGLLNKGRGKLGIFGFGSAAHLIAPIAIKKGLELYVFTRGPSRQELGLRLGAKWAGRPGDSPGVKLDAALVFAPVGSIVVEALRNLDKAGKVVIGEIHMTPIEKLDYGLLWLEREIKTVANVTRDDVKDFLFEALRAKVTPRVRVYGLKDVNQALKDVKDGKVDGTAVLKIS